MQNIQEVFNQIQAVKKEQRSLKAAYREALTGSPEYKEIVEQIKALKEKKNQIENNIKEEFSNELDKLDALKTDIESNNLILSDIALNKLVKGEAIEIVDAYNNAYEPVFVVKFKKTNVIKNEGNEKIDKEPSQLINSQADIFEINRSLD